MDIFVANSFVKVSIYRKLASRNHILAGYELFMSIYNLQTRTGLNNFISLFNILLHLNFISVCFSATGTKQSGIRYTYVLTDGQIDGIPREFHAFVLVNTYFKHTHIISVFL